MAEQYHSFKKLGVEIIAVTSESMQTARRYFLDNKICFPCVIDPEKTVYRRYGVASRLMSLGQRPGIFVIDLKGLVQHIYIGRQQWELSNIPEIIRICTNLVPERE